MPITYHVAAFNANTEKDPGPPVSPIQLVTALRGLAVARGTGGRDEFELLLGARNLTVHLVPGGAQIIVQDALA